MDSFAPTFVCILIAIWLYKWLTSSDVDYTKRRGRPLLTAEQAKRAAASLAAPSIETVFFGGLDLPEKVALLHFAFIGRPGSGKTLSMRMLLESLLRPIATTPTSDRRAFLNDPKGDMIQILFGMNLSCPIRTLHPHDIRGTGYDIAKDCVTPATAQQFAIIFIPLDHGPNRYFSDAARDILTGIMTTLLIHAPGRWTLVDVTRICKSRSLIEKCFKHATDPNAIASYLADDRGAANILCELQTRMAPFDFIAAGWHWAADKFSITDWIREPSVLILPSDESNRAAMDAVNRLIFQRLIELILAEPETEKIRFVVALDEIRELGKIEKLGRLCTNGRSKGCTNIFGFQDSDGMADALGENLAKEIVAQAGNQAWFRTDSPTTAQRGSDTFGTEEFYEMKRTQTGDSVSSTHDWVNRHLVLPSEFMNLPLPSQGQGLSGYYLTPLIGAYKMTIPPLEISKRLNPLSANTPNCLPRPAEHQLPPPWTEDDDRRLGFD